MAGEESKLAWITNILATTTSYIQANRTLNNSITQEDWDYLGIPSNTPTSNLSPSQLNQVATAIQDRIMLRGRHPILGVTDRVPPPDQLGEMAKRARTAMVHTPILDPRLFDSLVMDVILFDKREAMDLLLDRPDITSEQVSRSLALASTDGEYQRTEIAQAILDSRHAMTPYSLSIIWLHASDEIAGVLIKSKRSISIVRTSSLAVPCHIGRFDFKRAFRVFQKVPLKVKPLVVLGTLLAPPILVTTYVTLYVTVGILDGAESIFNRCRRAH